MKHSWITLFFLLTLLPGRAQDSLVPCRVFSFEQSITLPGSPEAVFDAVTGDISPWWDHSFSEKPYRLYIEPKPGGGFFEIFDERGNGVKHATVIYADRGKMLRFDGPLGLSGLAITMVSTYTLEPLGSDSTTLALSVSGAGEVPDGLPAIIEKVWHHFLFERLGPYMEKGRRP
jgi:hypothetical protein